MPNETKPGETLAKILQTITNANDHRAFLAWAEQEAARNNDIEALREIRAYREKHHLVGGTN